MSEPLDILDLTPKSDLHPHPDRFARLVIGPLLGVFVFIVLVFYVFFSFSRVEGDSMLPTLETNDRFLMTKSYAEPHRGDIVVFGVTDRTTRSGGLIKRVVALEGDSIEVRGGVATVNGVRESPGHSFAAPDDPAILGPLVVPEDSVFVLGDNRPVALDSRQLGPVPISIIVGRVVFVWGPLGRIGVP